MSDNMEHIRKICEKVKRYVLEYKKDTFSQPFQRILFFSCFLLIIYIIRVSIIIMRFQKIPYYLKHSVDEIILHARKNITVHYVRNVGKKERRSTECQITDHNNYGDFFYEPHKFEILDNKIIKCADQLSAHQNGVIALKKWESELRIFLSKPMRKMIDPREEKSHTRDVQDLRFEQIKTSIPLQAEKLKGVA
jgi:hypothetical protein